MNHRGIRLRIVFPTLVAAAFAGCADSKLDSITQSPTLTVKYVSPGPTGQPCDDRTPILDGFASDEEWGQAEPVYLRVDGDKGTGGAETVVEVRAVWVDDERVGGRDNRIYVMVRYEDDDIDDLADALVYGSVLPTGEILPSPPPEGDCDDVIVDPSSWTRINANGREDQVLMLVAAEDPEGHQDLVEANRQVMAAIGSQFSDGTRISGASDVDVWMWRASRTNDHPIPQFAAWDDYIIDSADFNLGQIDAPQLSFSKFPATCGFFEDFYIDGGGNLKRDPGLTAGRDAPYVSNFAKRDPVPERITQPNTRKRSDDGGPFGGGGPDLTIINAGLPVDRVLWWNEAVQFTDCQVTATSQNRAKQDVWGGGCRCCLNETCEETALCRCPPFDLEALRSLTPEESMLNDLTLVASVVRGWGIITPTGSARDVRGKGAYQSLDTKAFFTRTVELMRSLKTGNTDDVEIVPGQVYRLVIGIFDGSGRRASGSTEIRVVFEPASPTGATVRRRC